MNRTITLFLVLLCYHSLVKAQEYVQVSVGPDYIEQAFYTLSNDEINIIGNESWDLAFPTGTLNAGVHYNEAAELSSSGIIPALKLYLAPTNNFDDAIDPAMLTDSLYNKEATWEEGAFNSMNDPDNILDFGWGLYNIGTHAVNGNKVFVLKLRDNTWKKIKIESLLQGVYIFKYADLDGANETTVTVDKVEFSSSPLAFFSFSTGEVTESPNNWDLLFARYLSLLDAGAGDSIQYYVNGVLSAPGVEVAEAVDIDPNTVSHEAYLDSMNTRLDVIGHDWKFYSLTTGYWEIEMNRAYFVKLPDNHLWKLVFVDFEGTSTGVFTFTKTYLGELTSINDPESNFTGASVFPNPVESEFTFSYSLKEAYPEIELSLYNSLGQPIWKKALEGQAGMNAVNVIVPEVPAGVYQLVAGSGMDAWTTTIFIQ